MLSLSKNSVATIGIVVTVVSSSIGILTFDSDDENSDNTLNLSSTPTPNIPTPIIRNLRYIATDVEDTWKDKSINHLYVIDTTNSNFSTDAGWINVLKNQKDFKKIAWKINFELKDGTEIERKINSEFKLMRIKDNSPYQWDEIKKTFPTQEQIKTNFEDIYFYEYVEEIKTITHDYENIFTDKYIFIGLETWSSKPKNVPSTDIIKMKIYLQDKDNSDSNTKVFVMKYKQSNDPKTCLELEMCKQITN